MDLDVEQAESLDDIINLISHLKADFGEDFIITLAPVASALLDEGNLSGFDYITLEQTAGSNISWYNAQFYSGFGEFYPDDQYIDIIDYMNLNPQRLVATTLTSSADGYGYIDSDEVVASINNLVAVYGLGFGGVAGWEYFNSIPEDGAPWQWSELMQGALNGTVVSDSPRVNATVKAAAKASAKRSS